MGSLAVDAISVLGTGITAYSFLESRLPEMRTQGATVEIRTSTGTNPATGVGGVEDTGGRVNRVWCVIKNCLFELTFSQFLQKFLTLW